MSASLGDVARLHRVRLLLQHGSTVSGHAHAGSDVDLAALFDGDGDLLSRTAELAADLQPFFPGREIDLVAINHADPLFLKRIVVGARLLAGPTRAFSELKMYAYRRYQDHRRFLAMEPVHVARALERLSAR